MTAQSNVQLKKITLLDVPLDTKPGALAEIYFAFRGAGLSVKASWAYETGPGKGMAHLYVEDVDAAEKVLDSIHKKHSRAHAVWAEGIDEVGVYAALLQKISSAGVNLHATDAMGVGGQFACAFWAEDKDFPALCKALEI